MRGYVGYNELKTIRVCFEPTNDNRPNIKVGVLTALGKKRKLRGETLEDTRIWIQSEEDPLFTLHKDWMIQAFQGVTRAEEREYRLFGHELFGKESINTVWCTPFIDGVHLRLQILYNPLVYTHAEGETFESFVETSAARIVEYLKSLP